jgi:hypothetical protein
MVAKLRTRTCQWPHYSRYELVANRISPVQGAKIHWYDPWRKYADRSGEQPPYVGLLNLVAKLRTEFGTDWSLIESDHVPPTLSESSRDAILAWTAERGPLGIFHHATLQAEDLIGNGVWARIGGRWDRQETIQPRAQGQRECLLQAIPALPALVRVNAGEHLSRFLGTDPPAETPAPDSEEFLARYSEPLWDWLLNAFEVDEAIRSRDGDGLNALAGPAGRERRFVKDGVESRIVFPSLIAAYGEMAWQDLEAGNRTDTCAYCGGTFITDRKWTKFCSRDCATKERQRRFLEKNPDYYRAQSKKGRNGK